MRHSIILYVYHYTILPQLNSVQADNKQQAMKNNLPVHFIKYHGMVACHRGRSRGLDLHTLLRSQDGAKTQQCWGDGRKLDVYPPNVALFCPFLNNVPLSNSAMYLHRAR